jgi:hypothetical protein
MSLTAVTSNIPQSLNILLHLPPKRTFHDDGLVDDTGNSADGIVVKILCANIRIDGSLGENVVRGGRTDSIDVPERVPDLLVVWNIYACNTGHDETPLVNPAGP